MKTRILALTASLISLGSMEALTLPKFTMDAGGTYSTDFINRGRKEGGNNCELFYESGLDFLGGHGYNGTYAVMMLENNQPQDFGFSSNESSPYVGYTHNINKHFNVDLGYIAHFYSNLKKLKDILYDQGIGIYRNSNEVYLGLFAEIKLNPCLYFSYDWERREFLAEFSFGYSYDLTPYGMSGFSLEPSFNVGYDSSSRPFGLKSLDETPIWEKNLFSAGKDYIFYGCCMKAVYTFNENARVRVGVHYSGNAGSKSSWQNLFGNHKNLLAFETGVDLSF